MVESNIPLIPSDNVIQSILAARVDDYRLSVGMAVGITDVGSRRLVSHGYSDGAARHAIDGDTIFDIGSVTKLFTLLLLSEMVCRGEVCLDDPVAEHLPPDVRVPERDGRRITLVDLATHTSGLPRRMPKFVPADPLNPYAEYTAERVYDFLSSYELPRGIGDLMLYSNLGMGLLGHALALRAGLDYETLILSRICRPLGMNSTMIALPPELRCRFAAGHDESLDPVPSWDLGVLPGMGALRSSASDLLIFLEALGDDNSPLAPAVNLFMAPREPVGGHRGSLGGLIWSFVGYSLVTHGGQTGGYRSYVGYIPEWRRGVVALSNSGVGPVGDLAGHLLDARKALVEHRREIEVDSSLLERYVGSYELRPEIILSVTQEADRLFVQATGQTRLRLFAETERRYFIKWVDAQITFEPGADGRAVSLVLHQNNRDQNAPRIA